MNQKREHHSLSDIPADRVMLILVLLGMVLGIFLAKDFGLGWDGLFQYRLGEATYKIYQHPFAPKTEDDYGPFSHEYHGPFYQTVAYSFSRFSTRIWGETYRYEAFFYADFLSFLLGMLSLYLLSKRFMSHHWALVTALLYVTQPLLFGHAFINPKDTPFLGLMLFSVYAGMRMVDQVVESPARAAERLKPWLKNHWQVLTVQRKKVA